MPPSYKHMDMDTDELVVGTDKSTMSKAIKVGWLFGVIMLILGGVLGGLIGHAVSNGGSCDAPAEIQPDGGSGGTSTGTNQTITQLPGGGTLVTNPPPPAAEEQLQWGSTAGPLTRSITPVTSMKDPASNVILPGNISIKSNFDAGNIFVRSLDTKGNAELLIVPDPFSPQDNKTFLARFLFRVTGAKDLPLNLTILNAEDVNVASNTNSSRWDTFRGLYQPRVSYDFKNWFQVPHSFNEKHLNIKFTPISDSVWFAYYPPYPLSHMESALGTWGLDPMGLVQTTVFAQSVLGLPLYLVTVGAECENKLKFWVTTGQHPSETQGPYFVEGMVDSALVAINSGDENVTAFFQDACLYVTPHLNPDGAMLGHHRTNALGHNLNRVWDSATAATSPEIYYLEPLMEQHGVDFYIDAHADEDNTGVFIFYAEGICAWNSSFQEVKDLFNQTLISIYPAFNGVLPTDGAYDPEPRCTAALKYSDNWVGDRFGVVAGTLEMPFQDVATHSNLTTGWGPERSYEFGGAVLSAFVQTLPAVKEFRGM